MMSDSRSLLHESLFLLADLGLTYFFYRLYRSRCTTADKIQVSMASFTNFVMNKMDFPLDYCTKRVYISLSSELKVFFLSLAELEQISLSDARSILSTTSNSTLEYTFVEGAVEPVGQSLKSKFTEACGPLKHFKRTALKSERHHGRWMDVTTTISDSYDKVPFALMDNSKNCVLVTDPLAANYLDEALHTTHDYFEPNPRSLTENVFDRIIGEINKGVHTTEHLLRNGTAMLGIGKLVLNDGALELRKPTVTDSIYVLSTMSREELVNRLKSKAIVFKLMAGVFGVAGVLILWVTVGTRIRDWLTDLKSRREMNQLREQLARMRQHPAENSTRLTGDDNTNTNNSCVVCLSNNRELALRPCAHVCVCLSCYEALPRPKSCPVCRASVTDVLPVFIS